MLFANTIKNAAELAKECDQMNLILNHCGVPPIASGEIDDCGKEIKSLSDLPNVTCKLSGLDGLLCQILLHMKQSSHM